MIYAKLIFYIIPILYIIAVWYLFGIQKSISDSYYRYYHTKWKWAFTLFCWSLAYPALMIHPTPLMFGAFALLGIVGASPAFKQDKYVKASHMIGAYGGVLFSQLSIFFDYGLWHINLAFITLAGLLFIFKVNNKIWWAEILAILSIYVIF